MPAERVEEGPLAEAIGLTLGGLTPSGDFLREVAYHGRPRPARGSASSFSPCFRLSGAHNGARFGVSHPHAARGSTADRERPDPRAVPPFRSGAATAARGPRARPRTCRRNARGPGRRMKLLANPGPLLDCVVDACSNGLPSSSSPGATGHHGAGGQYAGNRLDGRTVPAPVGIDPRAVVGPGPGRTARATPPLPMRYEWAWIQNRCWAVSRNWWAASGPPGRAAVGMVHCRRPDARLLTRRGGADQPNCCSPTSIPITRASPWSWYLDLDLDLMINDAEPFNSKHRIIDTTGTIHQVVSPATACTTTPVK